jgi:hypothetical protein
MVEQVMLGSKNPEQAIKDAQTAIDETVSH